MASGWQQTHPLLRAGGWPTFCQSYSFPHHTEGAPSFAERGFVFARSKGWVSMVTIRLQARLWRSTRYFRHAPEGACGLPSIRRLRRHTGQGTRRAPKLPGWQCCPDNSNGVRRGFNFTDARLVARLAVPGQKEARFGIAAVERLMPAIAGRSLLQRYWTTTPYLPLYLCPLQIG